MALQLRSKGVDARVLEGGLDGWRAAGLDVEPTEPGEPMDEVA